MEYPNLDSIKEIISESATILAEEHLSTKQRKNLPEEAYGLPAKKAYPLIDIKHTRSAMAYFRFVKDPADKKILATNIKKACEKFKIHFPDTLAQYV